MSADNFNVVRQCKNGKWNVWLNLSASDPTEPQIADRLLPAAVFETKTAAIEWAEQQGYTEYGTRVENARMTYADLKEQLATFTPEQLAMPVTWTGDERGGYVKELWVAEEDWIGDAEIDCTPRSELNKSEPEIADEDMPIIIAKGTPQLVVD